MYTHYIHVAYVLIYNHDVMLDVYYIAYVLIYNHVMLDVYTLHSVCIDI